MLMYLNVIICPIYIIPATLGAQNEQSMAYSVCSQWAKLGRNGLPGFSHGSKQVETKGTTALLVRQLPSVSWLVVINQPLLNTNSELIMNIPDLLRDNDGLPKDKAVFAWDKK